MTCTVLHVTVAGVSSVGEEGLHIINPANCKETEADFRSIALIGLLKYREGQIVQDEIFKILF